MGAGDYGRPAFATAENRPAYRHRGYIWVAAGPGKSRLERISELVDQLRRELNRLSLADRRQARDYGHGTRPRGRGAERLATAGTGSSEENQRQKPRGG